MIVRHFLQWIRTAPAAERAEASSALARAYLYSDLSGEDKLAAEGAMVMLLDDPSPLVRRALAVALASSPDAPPRAILALAGDQPEIAAIVLASSPLLADAELVELLATGVCTTQVAIASRHLLPRSVAAAIAEVGSAEACLVLIENPTAQIAASALSRIASRFGDLAAVREALFARDDLPASIRQSLVRALSRRLGQFVAERHWLEQARAERVAREACEKATVALAGNSAQGELRALIRHLRETAQLNAGLLLRALLSGNLPLFEEALAELSGIPAWRVRALIQDRQGSGLAALCAKSGLPRAALPAVEAALDCVKEAGQAIELGPTTCLKRQIIERVLARCDERISLKLEPVLALLRRFATEAAREEARLFCQDLVLA